MSDTPQEDTAVAPDAADIEKKPLSGGANASSDEVGKSVATQRKDKRYQRDVY